MVEGRQTGTLKVWKSDRGFGFIKPEDGSQDVFIHVTAIRKAVRGPKVGDIILYTLDLQNDGRLRAVNASIQGLAVQKPSSRKQTSPKSMPQAQRKSARSHGESSNSRRNWWLAAGVSGISIMGLAVIGIGWLTASNLYSNDDGAPLTDASPPDSAATIPPEPTAPLPEATSSPPEPVTSPSEQVAPPPEPVEAAPQSTSVASRPVPPPADPVPTVPDSAAVTPNCNIKGNISWNSGNRYYHLPGMEDYAITEIDADRGERWFCSEAEAEAAGWSRAPTP
ncbi:cold shock domain-containing protein [Halomicronema sp. CCY15110]|uniref:cold shock domain-containing protein n=1 Tax=Halomicronema sp. CCY15110 TaxID=2767773 RepID=UPI00194FA5DC|nr:cold shock domain-containing protein [Halomicronema sp. CCY15110]